MSNIREISSFIAICIAASKTAVLLRKRVELVPEFMTAVASVSSDGIEFALGRGDEALLDLTYEVARIDEEDRKKTIGYTKVRNIRQPTKKGEPVIAYAEKVKEYGKFIEGDSLIKQSVFNFNIGIHPVFQYMIYDFPLKGKVSEVFGFGFYSDLGLGFLYDVSELYISFDGDLLILEDFALIHGMIGLKKKWYINSLICLVGARVGASYLAFGDDDRNIGLGGDLYSGFEYYFSPEYSVYLNLAGRFFTNPLYEREGSNHEVGINGSFGLRIGF